MNLVSKTIIFALFGLLFTYQARAAEPLNLPITFELDRASTVTVVIEDAAGKRVCNLASAVRLAAGKQLLSWDGYDDGEVQPDGSTIRRRVAPGSYRARGLTSDGIRLIYEFPVNSPGTPPWFTKERNGAWLADHTSAQAVVAVSASDTGFLGKGQSRVIFAAITAECGDAFMALDLAGKKIIGNNDFGWTGAYAMALDRGPLAPGKAGDPWLYCVVPGDDTVSLNLFTHDGKAVSAFKHKARNKVTWNGGKTSDSIAAWNGIVVISVPHDKELLVVDPVAKRLLGRIAQDDPRGVMFDNQGRLLVASKSQIKRLTLDLAKATVLKEEVAIGGDLEDAQQMTQDKAGNLYVGDWGKSHQVKVFSPAGKLLRTIGKPGGPQFGGGFDNERLHNPKGLAIDDQGQLWVADADHLPKRITAWSTADGKLVRALIGGPKYGGGGTLDPEDRTKMYYGIFNGGYSMKLDWAKGTAVVDNVYSRPEQWNGTDRDKSVGSPPEDVFRVGGNTYLVDNINGGGGNPGANCIWRLGDDGKAWPVAIVGGLQLQEDSNGAWNAARNPGVKELFKTKDFNDLMIWSDRNLDGRAQPDEFVFWRTDTPYLYGARFNADFSFITRGFSVAAPDILPNGVPVWPAERKPVELTGKDRPNNGVNAGDGWVLHVGDTVGGDNNSRPGRYNRILGYHNGQVMWDYPSLDGPVIPSNPGTIIMARRFIGMPFTSRQGEAGEIFGINGEKGSMYLMTTDGLFIQDVGGDNRIAPHMGTKYPVAKRGMVVEGVSFHDEHYCPSLSQTKEGDVILIAGKEYSAVHRVDGLASVKRRDFATVTLDAARLAGLPETITLPSRSKGKLSLSIAFGGAAPQVDGDLADWKESVEWAKLDDRASAAVRIVGDRLYAAWRTGDANALANAKGEPKLLFKRGGAVDLMIGCDPKAAAGRREPAAGDIRLLASMQDGKPTAVIYRAVVPGTAEADRVPFESPVGRVVFDRVDDVSDSLQLVQKDGDIELSIPLAVLGLKEIGEGVTLLGDIGILRGTGAMTTQRLYWNNLDTSICSDVPSEARLQPANWGTWRLIPTAMFKRIEAVAPSKDMLSGLSWSYIEGKWDAATDLSKQTVTARGNAKLPDAKDVPTSSATYAVIYEGFIEIPRDGVWTFSSKLNDDGLRMWVAGRLVLQDTQDRSNDIQSHPLTLAPGLHPLRIEFIQKGGEVALQIDWTGPSQRTTKIPGTAFGRKP